MALAQVPGWPKLPFPFETGLVYCANPEVPSQMCTLYVSGALAEFREVRDGCSRIRSLTKALRRGVAEIVQEVLRSTNHFLPLQQC